MDDEIELFDDCFIDVLSFTKEDWDIIEILAQTLKNDNIFKGDVIKCTVGAVALFVNEGKGLREADH